jgi:hypothetical protein
MSRFVVGFALGAVAGVYAAQNYKLPLIADQGRALWDRFKRTEAQLRKPDGAAGAEDPQRKGGEPRRS